MKKKKEIKEEDLKNVSGGTNTPLANAPVGLVGSVPMGVTGSAPQANVSAGIDIEVKPMNGIYK